MCFVVFQESDTGRFVVAKFSFHFCFKTFLAFFTHVCTGFHIVHQQIIATHRSKECSKENILVKACFVHKQFFVHVRNNLVNNLFANIYTYVVSFFTTGSLSCIYHTFKHVVHVNRIHAFSLRQVGSKSFRLSYTKCHRQGIAHFGSNGNRIQMNGTRLGGNVQLSIARIHRHFFAFSRSYKSFDKFVGVDAVQRIFSKHAEVDRRQNLFFQLHANTKTHHVSMFFVRGIVCYVVDTFNNLIHLGGIYLKCILQERH